MKRWICFAGLLSVLLTACSSFAAGLIVVGEWPEERTVLPPPPHPFPPPYPRPSPPPRPYHFAPLEMTSLQANVRIKDQIAVTAIDQEFYNPNSARLEGTFLFPVPKGAHLNKFSMEIDGKQVEAELLTADKARQIYEDIVRKAKDPALLEYSGRDLFKVRIFPIEPQSKKRVKLSYSQLLKADGGLVGYVYPLNTSKYSAQPIRSVGLKVELDSKRPLRSIYSPSHKVEVRRDGDHKATIGYEASDVRPDTDFQLFFAQEQDDIGVNLLTHKTAGEDGYFLLLAAPGVEVDKKRLVLKDVAFVLDTSGSMAGKKLEQAKKALQFCVENLNDGDRFEILRFATEAESLFGRLTAATRENRTRADEFIKALRPIGGTAIHDALVKGLSLRAETSERPFVVIFLTDGLPTVGITSEDQIVAAAKKHSGGNTRVFCFGIGTDVNTHLLDKIAEETKAFTQYVLPEEDLELKVSSFFTKIKEPVLANLRLTFPEGIRATKLYPSPLPDLFRGEQLLLAGRYTGGASGGLELEGTINGALKKFSYNVKFSDTASDHDFIPRLWATRRVGYLLDEIRLRGENQELKEEVTDLARKYGIVTPYTAYLILEDEGRRNVAENVQSLPQLRRDRVAQEQLGVYYRGLNEQKTGEAAVAGARYGLAFKSATISADALTTANQENVQALSSLAPAAAGGFGGVSTAVRGGGVGGGIRPAQNPPGLAAATPVSVSQINQQARFVSGRNFFQNGNQWIDAQVQKMAQAKRQRIQFNSVEYFDLAAQQPSARSWLALGRNVQFVLGEVVYEIYE